MFNYLKRLDDKYLLSPKFLYFFINLQFYTLHQFRGNFFTDFFKISKSLYVSMLGAILFMTFFTNIFLATLNDKFQRPRLCVIGLLFISCLFFQLFFVNTYIQFGFGNMMMVINLLLYLCFNTSIPPLLDKITLEHLQSIPNVGSRTYGKQRLWGTIGYLFANLFIEKSLSIGVKQPKETPGVKQKKNYNFQNLRIYQIITTIIASLMAFFLIKGNNREEVRRNEITRSWNELLSNKPYLFFIFIIFLNGITRAAMTMFLTIYLTDIVKLSGYQTENLNSFLRIPINIFNKNPISTTTFFGMILEIIILWYASKITTRFGLYWPLLFAQVFQLLRFTSYFLMNHDATHAFAFVCAFELMKGLNFGLTHIAAVQIATNLSPVHLKTTSQMIYSGTFTGLASACAGFIFGKVFKEEAMKGKENFAKSLLSFRMFFMVNIAINIISIALFIIRYGIFDKTLSLSVFRNERHTENDPHEIKQNITECAVDIEENDVGVKRNERERVKKMKRSEAM